MKNALILKLMDYVSETKDFMYLLEILGSTDDQSSEFRQMIDDTIEEVGISLEGDQEDKEREVVCKTLETLNESGAKIIHNATNAEIVKFTKANSIPSSIFRAWMEDDRFFYISSLTELTLQLGDKIYRFKDSRPRVRR